MKAATLAELKRELVSLPPHTVLDLCVRLAKYKKENKELLTYLLFEADDEGAYIHGIKEEMDTQFREINKNQVHFAKKGLRKILRTVNKYIKFSGNKQTEAELLIYYCHKLNGSGIRFRRHVQLLNLYERQIEKAQKAISILHEDLQYDYEARIRELED